MTKNFKDFFSEQAEVYKQYRPRYPQELYNFIFSQLKSFDLAWDCATGNGQAAVDLCQKFKKVIATDASSAQIEQAMLHPQVTYRVATAEQSGIEDNSVSLITVAQAVHWFNFELFYKEAKRVLKPQGVLAVWGYAFHRSEDTEIDFILKKVSEDLLGSYWQEEPKLLWNGYKTLPFPFTEIKAPAFHLAVEWDLNALIGYISSWSATQKFRQEKGLHPVELVFDELLKLWGDPHKKRILTCPLPLRIGVEKN